MLLALCVIGKGERSGIHARIFPFHETETSDRPYTSGEPSVFPSKIASAIRDRWAPLSANVIPTDAGRHLLKVSRHLDGQDRVWTWIGYYQFVEFDGEDRGGHYFGVGIAFSDMLVSGDVGGFLNDQLDRLAAATFRGNKMARSIFDDDVSVEAAGIARRLRFELLPESFGGLDPEATTGIFRQEPNWTSSDVEQMINLSLRGSDQQRFAGFFFGNWAQPPTNSRFYMADNESVGRLNKIASRQSSSTMRPETSAPMRSGGESALDGSLRGISNAGDGGYIVKRLEAVDRKIGDILKHIQRIYTREEDESKRKSRLTKFQWIVVFLLSSILITQLCLLEIKISWGY